MSQIDKTFLNMIRCPVTKSRLLIADTGLIERLNYQIQTGVVHNRAGEQVENQLDGGLVNADSDLLLPIRGGIVRLIADQAIVLSKDLESKVDRS